MVKLGMGAWSPLVLCLYTHFYWLGFYVQFFWSNRQTYYYIIYICVFMYLFLSFQIHIIFVVTESRVLCSNHPTQFICSHFHRWFWQPRLQADAEPRGAPMGPCSAPPRLCRRFYRYLCYSLSPKQPDNLFLWVQLGYSKSYWCLVGNGGMTHNIPQLFSQSSQQPPLIIIDLQVIPSSGPIAIRKKTRRAFRSATSSFNAFVLRPPGNS